MRALNQELRQERQPDGNSPEPRAAALVERHSPVRCRIRGSAFRDHRNKADRTPTSRRAVTREVAPVLWPAFGIALRDSNFTRARLKTQLQRTDERLDRYLDPTNEVDADDAGGIVNTVADLQDRIASLRNGKQTLERHRQAQGATAEARLLLTGPDYRSMHSVTRIGGGYSGSGEPGCLRDRWGRGLRLPRDRRH